MKYLFKRGSRNTYYYKHQETHLLIEEQFKRLRQGLPRDQVISNYQAATALLRKRGLTESDAEATGDGADEAKESFLNKIKSAGESSDATSAKKDIFRRQSIPCDSQPTALASDALSNTETADRL